MKPETVVYQTPAEMASAAAEQFAKAAAQSISERGIFAVALSGGSTPQHLFEILASPPYATEINWSKTHVFWADDRCVPPDADGSNYKQARLALLDKVAIPPENIWRIRTELSCEAAVTDYISQLERFRALHQSDSAAPFPLFDLTLLGMGTDGHTASLFPNSPISTDIAVRIALANYGGRPAKRVTLTESILNAARQIIFLVAGAGKAQIIKTVLYDADDTGENALRFPVLRIRPKSNNLIFYLDELAASQLTTATRRKQAPLPSSQAHLQPARAPLNETFTQLDEIDRTLLQTLQSNARLSNAELARRVELSPSGLQKRLRRLEDQGTVQQYAAILDRKALGYDMLCIVNIVLNRNTREGIDVFREKMKTLNEVQECFQLTGNDDYMLKIVVRDVDHLEKFLSDTLAPIPAISRFRTSIVLKQVKSSTRVPIEFPDST